MQKLKNSGLIFRHETVGFGIKPTSVAARDLRHIATERGGKYHHTTDATQLGDIVMAFLDTIKLLVLFGTF